MKLNKVMSLAMSSILSMGIMVGCNKNKILQNEINTFESVNKQEIKSGKISEYLNSFNIEGLNTEYMKAIDLVVFEVVIDEEIYEQFQKDVKEIGLKEAREKYGINELIENMIATSIEQEKTIDEIDNIDVQCRIVTSKNYKPYETLVISVYKGDIEKDVFK